MIGKKKCFCDTKAIEVMAIVEEISKTRKKSDGTIITYLNCDNAKSCDKETFCKFVNPLTTRIPLLPLEEQPIQAV